MRDVAHMTLSGLFLRMPQQLSVISGTSTVGSISGKSTSDAGAAASMAMPSAANRRANPSRTEASSSPVHSRAAAAMVKPFAESHFTPSMAGIQLRLPRSASCRSRV